MTRTTPTPGVDGRFKDKNLPKRLGERELDKSYAPLTAIPSLTPLMRDLSLGRSTALWLSGDSTGNSDGANPDPTQESWPIRFLRDHIAPVFPNYMILARSWNPTTEQLDPYVVIKNQVAGRRYAEFAGRSMRYVPPAGEGQFTSGNIDVAVNAIDIAPNANERALTVCYNGDDIPYGTQNVYRFRMQSNGNLAMSISSNGTTWDHTDSGASVPEEATWFRCTWVFESGVRQVIKFYTSADAVTWTQLGPTQDYPGDVRPVHQSVGAFFEIGGEGWQPAANTLNGKIIEVRIRDGVDGPLIAPALPELWERYPEANTTFGGAPTLIYINGSRSGAAMDYHTNTNRLKMETPNYGQVAAIFNNSHNEGGRSGSQWLPPYEAWVAAVQSRLPKATATVVGQNPHMSTWPNEAAYGLDHQTRIAELVTLAARKGWGFLDLYSAYLFDGRPLSALIGPDGLHPQPSGHELAAAELARKSGL